MGRTEGMVMIVCSWLCLPLKGGGLERLRRSEIGAGEDVAGAAAALERCGEADGLRQRRGHADGVGRGRRVLVGVVFRRVGLGGGVDPAARRVAAAAAAAAATLKLPAETLTAGAL